MITTVTRYRAEDGSIHDTQQEAELHEHHVYKVRLAVSLATSLNLGDRCINDATAARRVLETFTSKNSRNIINELLTITADSSNT